MQSLKGLFFFPRCVGLLSWKSLLNPVCVIFQSHRFIISSIKQHKHRGSFTHSCAPVQLGLKWSALYYSFTVLGNCSIQWLMYFSALFLSEDRLIRRMFCWWRASEDERNLWVPRQWLLELFLRTCFQQLQQRKNNTRMNAL